MTPTTNTTMRSRITKRTLDSTAGVSVVVEETAACGGKQTQAMEEMQGQVMHTDLSEQPAMHSAGTEEMAMQPLIEVVGEDLGDGEEVEPMWAMEATQGPEMLMVHLERQEMHTEDMEEMATQL